MTYSIQGDNLLKYYVYFPQESKGNINRSHEHNFYMTQQQLTDAETFLLMPAAQDSRNWYYVFSYDPAANACWTIGTEENDRLSDSDFTGEDNQKFAFEDAGNGKVYIFCKGSGKYLFRSDKLYYAHHPIRQSINKDSSQYLFSLKQRTTMPVSIPSVAGQMVKDSNLLYTTQLLGIPPSPTSLEDVTPAPLDKVFIGETLLPFFNVGSDPEVVGSNLVKWQTRSRPYYRYRREQQYQATGYQLIPPGSEHDETYSVTWGAEQTTATSIEEKTGFTLGFTSNHQATMGFKGVSATASHGFNAQWQRELTVTITQSLTESVSGTLTETLSYTGGDEGALYVPWQVMDIWTIFFGSSSDWWSVAQDAVFSRWYPATMLEVREAA